MRHVVTGGGGFIGSYLADALVARGDEVLVLDDFSTGRTEDLEHLIPASGLELVTSSILDGDLVNDCVESVDCVFRLASPSARSPTSLHTRPTD